MKKKRIIKKLSAACVLAVLMGTGLASFAVPMQAEAKVCYGNTFDFEPHRGQCH